MHPISVPLAGTGTCDQARASVQIPIATKPAPAAIAEPARVHELETAEPARTPIAEVRTSAALAARNTTSFGFAPRRVEERRELRLVAELGEEDRAEDRSRRARQPGTGSASIVALSATVPCAAAPPARSAAARNTASATSSRVAPAFFAAFTCTSMQYTHCVVCATAIAMSSRYLIGILPSFADDAVEIEPRLELGRREVAELADALQVVGVVVVHGPSSSSEGCGGSPGGERERFRTMPSATARARTRKRARDRRAHRQRRARRTRSRVARASSVVAEERPSLPTHEAESVGRLVVAARHVDRYALLHLREPARREERTGEELRVEPAEIFGGGRDDAVPHPARVIVAADVEKRAVREPEREKAGTRSGLVGERLDDRACREAERRRDPVRQRRRGAYRRARARRSVAATRSPGSSRRTARPAADSGPRASVSAANSSKLQGSVGRSRTAA